MKSQISTARTVCAVCSSSHDRLIAQLREHEYPDTTDDIFRMVECCECGAIRLNPRPDISEFSTIYPEDYFAFDLNSDSSRHYWSPKSISLRRESRRFRALVERCLVSSPRHVYDIGCGDGAMLTMITQLFGDDVATSGCEVNLSAANRASQSGHQVQHSLFEECEVGDRTFDMIITSHVIEHVASPLEFLRKAAEMMDESSILVVDTPNTDNPVRHLFGRHWGGWHTPRHWNLFHPHSLRELASRAGLEVLEMHQMTINMFWVWSIHSLLNEKSPRLADKYFNPRTTISGGLISLVSLAVFQLLDRIILLLTGRAGQVRVVLRRVGSS